MGNKIPTLKFSESKELGRDEEPPTDESFTLYLSSKSTIFLKALYKSSLFAHYKIGSS